MVTYLVIQDVCVTGAVAGTVIQVPVYVLPVG